MDLVVPYLQTNLEVPWNWAFRQTWCRSSWFGSSSTWGHSLGLGLCLRLRLYLRGCLRSSFGLDLKCSGHSHPKRGQNLYIWCIQWTRVYNHQISSTSTYIDTFWYHNTYLDTNLQQHLYSFEQFFCRALAFALADASPNAPQRGLVVFICFHPLSPSIVKSVGKHLGH